MIDKISDYRDLILLEIKQNYEGYCLTDDQAKVFQAENKINFSKYPDKCFGMHMKMIN
jgi:hypothetical protein